MTQRLDDRRPAELRRCTLLPLASCVVLAGGLMGCVSAGVEQFRQAPTGIVGDDAVVVMAKGHHRSRRAERGFTECLGETLAEGEHSLQVYSSQDFMDGLFPWFEPKTAPRDVDGLADLLTRPAVAEELAETKVRYLVWIDGATQQVDGGGGMGCAAGPGGGGCFGFLWWEKDAAYEASVWDLKRAVRVGLLSSEASGTSYVPAVIVPIPLIARTQAAACRGLGRQLKAFLSPADGPQRAEFAALRSSTSSPSPEDD